MRFYGQFNPPVDEFIYERYFKKSPCVGKGFFIECGAFDGLTDSSCKFFEEELKWQGINVEPSPPIYDQLIINRPDAINVNAALSNETGWGEFKSVIHPVYGELCTNGSLSHTEDHKDSLEEIGCSFKEYRVPIMKYSDLIKKYHVRRCDLFVLDVEGNELSVIDSMSEKFFGRVLPKIFVVEYGHLDKQVIINSVEKLGYKYDTRSYVNLYFVRYAKIHKLFDWIKKKLNIYNNDKNMESDFFVHARRMENFVEGEEINFDISQAIIQNKVFADVGAVVDGEYYIIYSVSGIEGQTSDGQIVYYQLEDLSEKKYTFKASLQVREDYANMRQSDLYLKCGARLIVKNEMIPAGVYQLTLYMERDSLMIVVPQKWELTVGDNNIIINPYNSDSTH